MFPFEGSCGRFFSCNPLTLYCWMCLPSWCLLSSPQLWVELWQGHRCVLPLWCKYIPTSFISLELITQKCGYLLPMCIGRLTCYDKSWECLSTYTQLLTEQCYPGLLYCWWSDSVPDLYGLYVYGNPYVAGFGPIYSFRQNLKVETVKEGECQIWTMPRSWLKAMS